MADLSTSKWSEVDASNNQSPPDGWPAGMFPDEVEPTARAMMGAIKRFYDHINSSLTSTGTANAHILTYAVAPNAYVKGDAYAFVAGAGPNTGAVTLNVNGLGVTPVLAGASVLTGGEIPQGSVVLVFYDGVQFQLIGAGGGGGSGTAQPKFRSISTGLTDTSTTTVDGVNGVIVWNSGTVGAKAQTIYACTASTIGNVLTIKDGAGTASATTPIVISATGNTFDGEVSYPIYTPGDSVTLVCDGVSDWNRV